MRHLSRPYLDMLIKFVTSLNNLSNVTHINTFATTQISPALPLGTPALLHNWDPCSTGRALGPTRSSPFKNNEQGPAITALSSLNLPMESGPSLVIMDHDNSSKEENGHQFAVRFFPRARHKPNLATRDKKHVREVAVVKPHDLTTVRNFLVDMILREQKFQQKTLVSWESVQRRYQAMVTDCDASDRDLLDHYQLELGFFPEVMDEQLLEVWTGKGSIIDVFSLPEFGELECVREPLPPYGLLVMLSRRQELLPKTISVAVGTDDSEEAPNQSNLRSKSKKTKRSQTPKQDTGFRPPPLIRPNSSAVAISAGIHKQLDSDHISDFKTPTICKTEDPIVVCNTSKTAVYNGNEILTDGFPAKCSTQPADIAPQAEDLPNPLTFFEQTSGVKGVNSSEARRASQTTESNIVPECSANCEEPRSSSVEKSELLSSCSVRCVDAASSLRNQVEPQRMCEQSPCSAANPFQCAPHENGDLRNSKTIGDEVLLPERVADSHISTTSVEGQHLPLKKHTRLDSAFCDEDEKDDHVPRNTVPVIAPVFHLPVKTAQASCAARSHKLVATNQITTVTTEAVENSDNLPQESSVLDCLVFPDTNDEVKRYLDFIRKAVAVHHLQRGVLPEMKDILKDLDEEVSAKWVDYVLMYIPEVSVMPYDGQIFMAWKGK